MGTALLKMKLMPSSIEADLENIKNKAKETIETNKGKRVSFEEEPIAFGLKAIIVGFDIDENDPLDAIEEKLKKIEDVNSVEVVDMRRAFG